MTHTPAHEPWDQPQSFEQWQEANPQPGAPTVPTEPDFGSMEGGIQNLDPGFDRNPYLYQDAPGELDTERPGGVQGGPMDASFYQQGLEQYNPMSGLEGLRGEYEQYQRDITDYQNQGETYGQAMQDWNRSRMDQFPEADPMMERYAGGSPNRYVAESYYAGEKQEDPTRFGDIPQTDFMDFVGGTGGETPYQWQQQFQTDLAEQGRYQMGGGQIITPDPTGLAFGSTPQARR